MIPLTFRVSVILTILTTWYDSFYKFYSRALHKHIQPHRQDAIKSEAKIVCVEMREVYQAYRAGTKCDAKLIPCNCVCHRQKTPQHWCAKCRSVHDLKKKFDYRPVRYAACRMLYNDYHTKYYI